jgi:hypothetical protein
MQITTLSNYRRSDEEVEWWTLSLPYFEGGHLRDRIYRLHPEFEGGKMLTSNLKRQLTGYGPNIPTAPKLYRDLLAPED